MSRAAPGPASLDWPQTIGALADALRARGWREEALARLLAAHSAIEPLFVGWRRASGRCFTAHLCGTAGLVAAFGGDEDLALAALAHAVYDEGAFGRAGGKHADRAQALLSATLPPHAAALVDAYSGFSWPGFVAAAEKDAAAAVAGANREIVLIRIANEIDDALDWPFFTPASRESGMREAAVCAAIADAVGRPDFAAFVRRALETFGAAPAAPAPPRAAAYFTEPYGYKPLLKHRLKRRIQAIWRAGSPRA